MRKYLSLALFSLLFLLLAGCGAEKIKDIGQLDEYFVENGIKAKDTTRNSEASKKMYAPLEAELEIKGRVDLTLSFAEGDVWVSVFDLRMDDAEKRLRAGIKKHIGMSDDAQMFTNGNLVMLFGGGAIKATDAHKTEIVKIFKSYK
ncbi:hypothetical protein [Paenibacillus tyrfis]|uniref:Lipoprotein n=1 Tax=Paenibacillus tyrfis TaxID=1501230 RepID=A0A081NV44_9BACL|nr:hypothetical protein [Paenibacillus tyrfis]KEQ22317.1 hypothetical protein ET33_26470 [Paenibacillus tyrfis]